MAHVREERALRPVCRLGVGPGVTRFIVALLHPVEHRVERIHQGADLIIAIFVRPNRKVLLIRNPLGRRHHVENGSRDDALKPREE